jgi:hypothetical protein
MQQVVTMVKTVCYNTSMNRKLAYVACSLILSGLLACGDDEPPPSGTGGRGGTGGSTGGTGGGGSGGTGGGGSGGTGGSMPDAMEMGTGGDGPGSETGGDGPAPSMASVTPAGRKLVSADGRLTLEIPPGAFRGPTNVSIEVVASPPAGGLGAVYEIEPAGEPLLVPGRIIFRYTTQELGAGKPVDFRIGLRDGDSWQALSSTVADATATVVMAQLTRLGVVALLPGLCDLCDATCTAENCKVGVSEADPDGEAGKCIDVGKGCKRCVPNCDMDGDGFCLGDPPGSEPGGDCADNDVNRFPGAREICGNMVDDDCNGHVDEACKTCNSHAECPAALEACTGGLCDVCYGGCVPAECVFGADPDNMIPGTMGRCATFGNGCSVCVQMCDADGDGYCPDPNPGNNQPEGDCNDGNAFQAPGLKEICGNGLDDNCDGSVDELCTDCDDDSDCARDLHVCRNGACIGCARTCTVGAACMFTSEGMMMAGKCVALGRNDSCTRCVPMCDEDADGFCAGDPPGDEPGGDCDPDNADVGPAILEICGNNEDDNCNLVDDEGCTRCTTHAQCPVGNACNAERTCEECQVACEVAECRFGVDENVPGSGVQGKCVAFGMGCQRCVPTCDADGDGFCPQANPGNEQQGGDCDDAKATTFPSAPEICGNGIDDDCDGRRDEDCAATTCATSDACGANQACSNNR